jgi:SAM-dependent methyltransferase
MEKENPVCIICNSRNVIEHPYPPNKFNGKIFSYYECRNCSSISIFPLPSPADMDLIYGINDHSYLLSLGENEMLSFSLSFKKYNYQNYQLRFLSEAKPFINGKRILDYGCGSGYYMAFAKTLGFSPVGIEYNKAFAGIIKKKTGLPVFSNEEFEIEFQNKKFDVIHLGHVLEHLGDPKSILNWLKQFSHSETIFIIDGPLEDNFCLSRIVINTISRLKNRPFNTYSPQHLSFTNYDSQLSFFENTGMKKLKYTVTEQYWPLPEKISTLADLPKYLLAVSSIQFSKLFKRHGNIFNYIGKWAE